MNVELSKAFFIEAAHRNPSAGGAAARLHGHSFRIEIVVEGPVDPILGWLIDYGDIKTAVKPLMDQLDHHNLNDVEGMADPTLPGIADWVYSRVKPALRQLKSVRVSVVGDNDYVPVRLEADPDQGLPHRIRFTFEAAQSLPHLPEGHPCRRLHGHTYRIEVGAQNLDALEPHVRDLYEELDHRHLNEIPGLDAATSERLCEWIWQRLAKQVDDLRVVIAQETATARCTYYGD